MLYDNVLHVSVHRNNIGHIYHRRFKNIRIFLMGGSDELKCVAYCYTALECCERQYTLFLFQLYKHKGMNSNKIT